MGSSWAARTIWTPCELTCLRPLCASFTSLILLLFFSGCYLRRSYIKLTTDGSVFISSWTPLLVHFWGLMLWSRWCCITRLSGIEGSSHEAALYNGRLTGASLSSFEKVVTSVIDYCDVTVIESQHVCCLWGSYVLAGAGLPGFLALERWAVDLEISATTWRLLRRHDCPFARRADLFMGSQIGRL